MVISGTTTSSGFMGGRLSIRTERGRLELHRELPQIEVDTTKLRSEVGYEKAVAQAVKDARFAQAQVAKGISDIVAAGDRMAEAYRPGCAFAELAYERTMLDLRDKYFNVDLIPKSRPRITVKSGSLWINYRPSSVHISYEGALGAGLEGV